MDRKTCIEVFQLPRDLRHGEFDSSQVLIALTDRGQSLLQGGQGRRHSYSLGDQPPEGLILLLRLLRSLLKYGQRSRRDVGEARDRLLCAVGTGFTIANAPFEVVDRVGRTTSKLLHRADNGRFPGFAGSHMANETFRNGLRAVLEGGNSGFDRSKILFMPSQVGERLFK